MASVVLLTARPKAAAPVPGPAPAPAQAWTRREVVLEAVRAANAAGIPPALLVALVWAESRLEPRAERWHVYTASAKAAIAAGDRAALRHVFERVNRERPGDISFGLTQIAWRWRDRDEFPGVAEDDLGALLTYRARHFDPRHCLPRGARRVAGYWRQYQDQLKALLAYNAPALGGRPKSPEHDRNYRTALAEAAKLLVEVNP